MILRIIIILISCAVFCDIHPAVAAPAWEWQLSLKGDAQIGVMQYPNSIFIDNEKERYYVVDSGNNRLISFDKTGKLLTYFNANQSLDTPIDMIRDSTGMLWVVERGRNTITKIDLKAKTVIPIHLKYKEQPVSPGRIESIGDKVCLYDRLTGDLLFLNQEAHIIRSISCNECKSGFVDFKMTSAGEIWALGQAERTLYHFTSDGEPDKKIILNDSSLFPVSFDVDFSGYFYLLDRHEGSIVVFDLDGRVKYRFLGKGHVRGRLSYPLEIRFDPWGRLCIVDEGNGRVEIFGH